MCLPSDNALRHMEAAQKLDAIRPHTHDDYTYNQRVKYYVNRDGEAVFAERMTCARPIFNPHGVERLKAAPEEPDLPLVAKDLLQGMTEEEYAILAATTAPQGPKRKKGGDIPPTDENRARAARRARRKVFDYVMAEYDFKYFITLTLNGADFGRDDIDAATKRLNNWLRNRVQRDGLKYVIVPELHKDGRSIHFHGFINDALRVVDSGTVVPPEGGKPIKRETAKRRGCDLSRCHTVYNLPDWLYGYTTAIEIYGEREAAAAYIAKYISKQISEGVQWDSASSRTKIAGRYYWHSNNLREPVYQYDNVSFFDAPGREFDTPAGAMRIEWPEKGEKTEQKGERV